MSIIDRLEHLGLIHPPKWLPSNVHYLTIMGSVAYGVSSDTSDCDVYGFAIPVKDDVFPHLRGEIVGFGSPQNRFEQWQEHHIDDTEAGKSYDFAVFSIVKYFHLVMKNNQNMIDSLVTPTECVLHATAVGQKVREHRKEFLHRGAWHTFKGYAYSQLHKLSSKDPIGKRRETIEKYGYDVKFAYHVVRLLNEIEQILVEGDLDLQRNREQLKSIRRGEWTEAKIREYFSDKESDLEKAYQKSSLPWGPDEDRIKDLLLECLEQHFGDLDKVITVPGKAERTLRQIATLCREWDT